MKKNKILALFIASIMTFMGLLTGCSTTSQEQTESDNKQIKDKLVYAIWSSPTGVFNPLLNDTTYDDYVIDLTYSSLLKFNKDGELVCDLAEKYEVSDDNLSFTFDIKKGAKWHDGKPVTAQDVAFTFEAMADKDYAGAGYGSVERLKGAKDYHEGKTESIEGIQVLNENTIKFKFEEVYSPGLLNIGFEGIIPKHIWGEVPVAKWKESNELLNNPIGSGPYKMSKFESGQYVELERFDDYYGEAAKTKTFIFKVTNQDTAQAELANKTIDIADVTTLKNKDIELLENDGFKIKSYPNKLIQYMGFNLRDERFKDKQIRQAFMYAINRKLMVEKLIEGNGVVINTPMLPSSWAYPKSDILNHYDYNIEKAKELLKEAGWEDKDGNGIVENSKNEEFVVELKYPTGNKTREKIAPIVQASLKELGVKVELSSMEFSTLMDQVVGNHEFELYLMGNNLDIDPDPKPYWHSTAASDEKGVYGWNISGLKNKEADALMEQGLSTLDMNERKAIYEKFAKLMNDELPWVYLFCQNTRIAYNPNLENFNPTTHLDLFDAENWIIYE
ncbi:MAG: peptide-binding protein [Tepidibacter sp.]|jgi:peptide/nickel transport system substrate-binding protein|uniref:peptide-binding protein n=1 Tax=Tepidibacter sp. TaxID=2529387 RepID=UPI0025D0BD1A|nr:peptide-binding protein [Tepidibacter sp.]MCT4507869.1 peptide-binding protein [Tepidibacter sp.]